MAVVVVESPAKAKTIEKYLGSGFKVLASYGHVRDLPAKDGSVRPAEDFAMDWEVDSKSSKRLSEIAQAVKDDGTLILATDPDREGEAISWHLVEALRARRALKKDSKISRVVFNAITKPAVLAAMQAPRQIDMALVEAYLARRALDYLVGFTLSPVLWRKLPGAKSAGRVQSVALRLLVEREMEIEAFKSREYWTISGAFGAAKGGFEARLVKSEGKKLEKFDLATEEDAKRAVAFAAARDYRVEAVEQKPAQRHPAPPFMTSTLQQEASRKLGFGAQNTMRVAQKLYEAGWITYMRTDGVDLAPEAVQALRSEISSRYGAQYLPAAPRVYKTKAKNAQEAHEAIRPTEASRHPDKADLSGEEAKLYDLIWRRAVASQMESARFERTVAEILSADSQAAFRATGQVLLFDGFLTLYQEGQDDAEDEDSRRLPALTQGEALKRGAIMPEQHFTQPPPRFTEASLVRRMEELGIGRPSTYASIITVVQDRGYARKDKGRLIPEDKGRLVTAFLENYFARLVQYDFTAGLEEKLDDVTSGQADWKRLLADFWTDFNGEVEATKELRVGDVLERINEALEPHVFPPKEDGSDPRLCPTCGKGRLSIRTGKFGAFIGCSNYPECRYTRPFGVEEGENGESSEALPPEGKLLGQAPDGEAVTLRVGRFGPYVQKGEGEKPPRASPPRGVSIDEVDLDFALQLLSLPRLVGEHPEGGEIRASLGRFGPYVQHEKTYANLPDWREVFSIGLNRAVDLLAQKRAKGPGRGAAVAPLKELGPHPEDGAPVNVMAGRYGPYVKWGAVNATLPKEVKPEDLTMEQALPLLAARAAASPKKKPAAKKAPAKAQAAEGGEAPKTKAAAKPKAAKAKTTKSKAVVKTQTAES